MAIETRVKLQHFRTPNFVLVEGEPTTRQEGMKEAHKYALKDLDAFTLGKLCDQFRADIFEKAGKADPNI